MAHTDYDDFGVSMKRAHPRWGTWAVAMATGVILGLLALFFIPVVAGSATPREIVPSPVPPVISPADPTALPPLDPDAPQPDRAVLGAGLEKVFSPVASGESGVRTSASVIDIKTGEQLYSRDGSRADSPASSLKVLTAIAATTVLGEDHRFDTNVLLKDPSTLVLQGGGDVLLGSGKGSDAISGRAGLQSLAGAAAKEILAARAEGKLGDVLSLQLDDSLFTGSSMNPAWHESLVTTNNITSVMPLALYGARTDAGAKSPRVKDPSMYAAASFATSLRAALGASAGSPVLSPDITRGHGGENATELARVSSATLGEQVRFMLEASDNYLAEALGRLTAIAQGNPGDFEHGAAAVQQQTAELGIETGGLALVDTSGLSDRNRVSPLTLASALRYAATSDSAALRDLSYQLPVAGSTGTLSDRLGAPSTRGMVRAKTGSLADVSSLSGLTVTRDGRALAFSFMVHTQDGQLAPHKNVLDAAASLLKGCG